MPDASAPAPLLSDPAAGLPVLAAGGGVKRVTSSLSVRLLILTVAFVMIAQIILFVPNVANYRLNRLNDKLATAHLVLTALDVAAEKTGQIDPLLRDNLLSQGRLLGMSVHRPGLPTRTFGPAIPATIPYVYDLRNAMYPDLIVNAFKTMLRRDTYAVMVIGPSPSNPAVLEKSSWPMWRANPQHNGRVQKGN